MNKIAILILIAINWISLSAKIPLQQAITRGIQKSLVIQNNWNPSSWVPGTTMI